MYSRLLVLGGTAIVATAGSVAGILLLPRSTTTASRCGTPRHAAMPSAMRASLERYAGAIRYDRGSSRESVDESWSDAVTKRSRNVFSSVNGRVQMEFATIERRRVELFTTVDYAARTWRRERQKLLFPAGIGDGALETAQANLDRVAQHKARIVGRVTVDGRSTLHLVEHQNIPAHRVKPTLPSGMKLPKGIKIPSAMFPAVHIRIDTWVDPTTYLTVRTQYTQFGRSSVTDERWLPRTPTNLAKTQAVIPKSFHRFVPSPGRGNAIGVLLNTAVVGCAQ